MLGRNAAYCYYVPAKTLTQKICFHATVHYQRLYTAVSRRYDNSKTFATQWGTIWKS